MFKRRSTISSRVGSGEQQQRQYDYDNDRQELFDGPNQPGEESILWSCVARNDIILAEAGKDPSGEGVVTQTARELLNKKSTPGWEFHTSRKFSMLRNTNSSTETKQRLKGVKFHLYQHDDNVVSKDDGTTSPNLIVWVFAAVYNGDYITKSQAQSFLEKIVTITEVFRECDDYDDNNLWKYGGTLSLQSTFAPILLQRMEEVTYLGQMALLDEKMENTRQTMQENIELLLEREEKLEALDEKATKLKTMAMDFKKSAKHVRRMKMMQDAKHGVLIGTAITATAAVIIVPPLVALL